MKAIVKVLEMSNVLLTQAKDSLQTLGLADQLLKVKGQ